MKKLIQSRLIISTVICMFSFAIKSFAFDYKISFTASGVKTSIDYVVVQNLTRGTTSTVTGGNLLELTAVQQVSANNGSLTIYPNPIQNKATVSYFSNLGGSTQLNIIGVDGRSLAGINKKLELGENHFDLTLPKGAYTLQINDNGQIYSAKILSQSSNTARIEFIGSEKIKPQDIQKIKTASVPMQYNLGDIILFKAYSGNYVSILTDIVSGDKTINFKFVECKDVDGNYYSTVTIGTQVWMAENLRTSKYRNNVIVTDKTNLSTWGTSTTEASSDYATPGNNTTYGKLYNWYAVSNTNNLAPLGWHVPTDADWTILSDSLGVQNLAGDKLKESGNIHWITLNTTATNSTGFTALPGGSKSTDNSFYDIGNMGYWWSNSEGTTTTNGWYRSLSNQNGMITRGYYTKAGGMSVRCVMGDLAILSTTTVSDITANGFISGGIISFDGNLPILSKGVCWSTNQNPTISDSKTNDGTNAEAFTSSITGLTIGATYYVRAYVTNSFGTSYGNQITVSTALPTVSTSSVSSITTSSANCGGNVTLSTGGASITTRGICWSTNQNPTLVDNFTTDGSGIGNYSSSIKDLNPETTYYVRAYATNSVGTSYGNQVSFSTKLPALTTTAISNLRSTSATCGGNITDGGGAPITVRGVCWSTSPSPTTALNTKTSNGTGSGSFVSSITGLNIGTTYYVRAYATSSIGTTYGNEISFSTVLATVSTNSISIITATTATCGGNVSDIGGAPVTVRGVCWNTSPTPTISNNKTIDGTGAGIFTSSITGLTAETTYYVRSYATNSIGTVYGNEISFSTKLPTITTSSVSSLTANSVTIGGNITDIGGAIVTERGVCWSTTTNPTITNNKTSDGIGTGSYTSQIDGLTAETTYYVRAYATNSIGTAYGNQITISTALPVVTTSVVSSITKSNATGGGSISLPTGAAPVTERGICWSTNQNPTIADNRTSDGTGKGTFSSSITNLIAETVYYVRAYATNSLGTSYGTQISFSTKLPVITTSNVSASSSTIAICGGNVVDIGGGEVTARGVCFSTNPSPTISDNKTSDGTGAGTFTSSIGLLSGTMYYVRAYATNSIGTSYGNEITIVLKFEIGQYANGGIVFYLDQTGLHGLVVSGNNQSSSAQWYNGGYTSTGATATSIGTGNQNTSSIITSQGLGNYAAKLCDDLVLDGFNDYYLPSKDELNQLFINRVVVNTTISRLGGTPLSGVLYWSSTENSTNSAFCQYFGTPTSIGSVDKNRTLYVRAIRAF